jgi:cytochrome b561
MAGAGHNPSVCIVASRHFHWVIVLDLIFVIVTGLIAWHGLTFRDEEGELETGHLMFGAIALLFCMRVLLVDLLDLF